MTVMFWPVVIFMAISLAVGLYTYTQVRGSAHRYTVCGKSMPFIVIGTALAAQAIDGNATMGNASLTYSTGIWAGIAIPLGLALSLVVVGRFLAAPLNAMDLMTLPEFFFRRYDKVTELLVSILSVVCFTILAAGNLAAVAWVLTVVSGIGYGWALLISTVVILIYTIAGGLYSAIYTDFFQDYLAIIGFLFAAIWVFMKYNWGTLTAAVPTQFFDFSGLTHMGGGALVNWASIISLAFGNAMALDFMERVFSANSPRTASRACYYAAGLTLLVGVCATILGIASWTLVPGAADARMVLPTLATHILPYWIGVLIFLGILGASMSTVNGAMLVISVVLARNVWQRWTVKELSDSKMLFLSRLLAVPTAAAGAFVAYMKPEPGMLLVVAFDIMFAGCVVPLFMGVYWKRANTAGAIGSIVVGTFARLVCYLTMPANLAGLDTLLPPVLSAIAFFTICNLTQPQKEASFAAVTSGD